MSKSSVWASRAFGYVFIGLFSLIWWLHGRDTSLLVLQVTGYVVIGVAMLAWGVLEARRPPNTPIGAKLAVLLGLVALIAGLVAASPNGEWVILMACIAAIVAGVDLELGVALAVGGIGILGIMIGIVLSSGASALEIIGFPLTIVSGLILGRAQRTYRVQAVQSTRLLEQSTQLLEQAEALQVQQRRADVLDERARIAREIHDVLAHSLGGLGIQIQAARAVLTDTGDIEKALDVLTTAQKLASDGLIETRRAVHALRTDVLSLDEELRNLAAGRGEMYGSTIEFSVVGRTRELPPAAAMALLRVAQEAVVNATKHAPRQPITLQLMYGSNGSDGGLAAEGTDAGLAADGASSRSGEPAALTLRVENPLSTGSGVKSALQTADSGYGLSGMRERLLLLGGTLDVGRRGDRWIVEAVLPDLPYLKSTTHPTETEG